MKRTPPKDRTPKKLDKLEVRLPIATKQAFTDRCRSEERTASEVLRQFIETYLARPLNFVEPPMKLKPTLAYGGVAAAAVLAMAAAVTLMPLSSRAEPDFAGTFKSLDTDANGLLSWDEFTVQSRSKPAPPPKPNETRAAVAAGFSETDTNKDGAISLAEFEAFTRAAMVRGFLALDADSDGRITLPELKRQATLVGNPNSGFSIEGQAEGFLVRFDADKDGAVTQKEFMEVWAAGSARQAHNSPKPS